MVRSPTTSDTRDEHVLVVVIVLVAIFVRLWRLGAESLWLDELWSVWVAQGSLERLFRLLAGDVHPPVHFLILNLWMRLAGSSEVAVRLPSVVAGVAAVVAVHGLGRRLFGVRVGLIAALLVATSPFQVFFAQEARSYALLGVLSILSMHTFVRVLEEGRRRDRLMWAVVTIMMLYTHYFAVFVVLSQAFLAVVTWSQRAFRGDGGHAASGVEWRELGVLGVTGVLLILPGAVLLVEQFTGVVEGFWVPPTNLAVLVDALIHLLGLRTIGVPSFVTPAVLAKMTGVVLLGLTLLALHRPGQLLFAINDGAGRCRTTDTGAFPAWMVLAAWIVVPVASGSIVSMLSLHLVTTRNLIVIAPALALLVALVVDTLKSRTLKALILAVVVAIHAVGISTYYRTDIREQWREAMANLGQLARPGDALVLDAPFIGYAVEHYLKREITTLGLYNSALADHPRVWLVRSHGRTPPSRIKSTLATHDLHPRWSRRFRGVEVTLYMRSVVLTVLPDATVIPIDLGGRSRLPSPNLQTLPPGPG